MTGYTFSITATLRRTKPKYKVRTMKIRTKIRHVGFSHLKWLHDYNSLMFKKIRFFSQMIFRSSMAIFQGEVT